MEKKQSKMEQTQGYVCPITKMQCDDECCVSAEDCHIKSWHGITELESLPCELESLSNIKQHEVTWIAALDYAIEKMKGLNNAESIDAFKKHYNETFGGGDEH